MNWTYLWRFSFICLLIGLVMEGRFSIVAYIFDIGLVLFVVMMVIRIKDVIEFMEAMRR